MQNQSIKVTTYIAYTSKSSIQFWEVNWKMYIIDVTCLPLKYQVIQTMQTEFVSNREKKLVEKMN